MDSHFHGNDRGRGTMHRAQRKEKIIEYKEGTIHCAPTKYKNI